MRPDGSSAHQGPPNRPAAKESKDIASDEGVAGMVHELIQDKVIA